MTLDLQVNQIGDNGVRALADAIKGGKMRSLKKLFADNNVYGDDAEKELQDACEPRGIYCYTGSMERFLYKGSKIPLRKG